MSTWELLAELPIKIEGYELQSLTREVSSDFVRLSTVLHLHGGGCEGVGEDVTYDAPDHEILRAAGPLQPIAGDWTLASFSEHVASLELFPEPPRREASRLYRIWAYESAALDLGLRQAGQAMHERLGREPRSVNFVISLRLGEPPSLAPVRERLDLYPSMRFKLDPTSSWSEQLIADLVATGAVDSVDFKGHYHGSIVDQPPDPVLYERVVRAFPAAWIEDPALNEDTEPILLAHRDRITWDAPIHSVADIEALPFAPKMVNIKPSRFGSIEALSAAYDYCESHGIGAYGGGQFELGPGRGQIQYLASLFHPDTPNDVAPAGYHEHHPAPGLPVSPLAPAPSPTGFRWTQ